MKQSCLLLGSYTMLEAPLCLFFCQLSIYECPADNVEYELVEEQPGAVENGVRYVRTSLSPYYGTVAVSLHISSKVEQIILLKAFRKHSEDVSLIYRQFRQTSAKMLV